MTVYSSKMRETCACRFLIPVDRGSTSRFRRVTRCLSVISKYWSLAMVCSRCLAKCWGTTSTRPLGRRGWRTCSCRPTCLNGALNVAVVRSGDRTILVDAGIGADPSLNLTRAGRTVQRLEAAGVDLPSVTDVVLTHMHMDHIGGLLTDGVRERLRPDLQIHVAAAEVEFWEVARLLARQHAARISGCAAGDGQSFFERVRQPAAAVQARVRGGGGSHRSTHRGAHARA